MILKTDYITQVMQHKKLYDKQDYFIDIRQKQYQTFFMKEDNQGAIDCEVL